MKRSKIVAACLLLFGIGLGMLGESQAQAPVKMHRVLFALTSADESDWGLLMGNIQNLMAGLPAGTVEVEVVAYSGGLNLVKKTSSAAEGVQGLVAKGVHFKACENSMRAQHVTAADLLPGVEPVPSGIVEVVTKEEQGWTYIKAGH